MADPQEEAFLAALAASPGDEGTRVVYADWLEERGDPRAEYVRIEAQLHALPAAESRHPRHATARFRLEVLERTLDRDWLRRVTRRRERGRWARRGRRASLQEPPAPIFARPERYGRGIPAFDLRPRPVVKIGEPTDAELDARIVCPGCTAVMARGTRICPACGRDRVATLRFATLSIVALVVLVAGGEAIRTCAGG